MSSEYRNLQDGYTQVEYIRHNYIGVIDTGVDNGSDISISIDFQIEEAKPGFIHAIIGCDTNTSKIKCCTLVNNKFDTRYAEFSQNYDPFIRTTATVHPQTGYTSSSRIYIFGFNNLKGAQHITRLYSATIMNNNDLVRDFVPAIRVMDGAVGLYDVITETFFTETNPIPNDYKLVEYVRSSGTQRISTSLKASYLTSFIARFKTWSSFSSVEGEYGTIFGESLSSSDQSQDYYLTTYSSGENLYGQFKFIDNDPVSANLKQDELITVSSSIYYGNEEISEDHIFADPNNNITHLSIEEEDPGPFTKVVYVFDKNIGGSSVNEKSSTALYNLIFYGSNFTVVRNYVPVISLIDSSAGLLDISNEYSPQFISSSNPLAYGPIVEHILEAGPEVFNIEQLTVEFGLIKDYPETTIIYEGDDDSGVTVVIDTFGEASGIRINRTTGGEYLYIDPVKLQEILGGANGNIIEYDHIEINTRKGKKSATLYRGGVKHNIIHAVVSSPKWLFLERGRNTFTFTADTGAHNLRINLDYLERVNGV